MRRALVTGAAGGIGRALSELLVENGYSLAGVDVDADAAHAFETALTERGAEARIRVADLAAREGVEEVLASLRSEEPLDLVVHNAGINCVGRFVDTDFADQRRVVELNLLAPILLTTGILADGLLAPGGVLVFVSSLSRFVGYPGAAGYAASKDGLASYARSLRAALARCGQRVLTVYPGPTRTEHARRYSPPGAGEERRMPPEELAARILAAVESGRRTLIPGVANRVFAAVGHALPAVTERAMKRAILDRLPG